MEPLRAWARSLSGALRSIAGNRSILRLEGAYLAGVTATGMLQVALVVVAFDAFGAGGIALLTLAQMVPAMVLVPVLAGLGDRVSRRGLLVGSIAVYACSVAATATILSFGGPPWLVLILAGVGTTAAGTTWATRGSAVPSLARSPQELIGSNVTSTVSDGLGALVGPLAAAALVLIGGPAVTAWVTVLVLGGGTVMAWGVRPPPSLPGAIRRRSIGARGLVSESAAGLRTLLGLPATRLISLGVFGQTLSRGARRVFLVVLAIDILGIGQAGVGTLNAAMGLGGLMSLMLTASIVRTGRLGRLLAVALLACGLMFALLAFTSAVPVAIALLAIVGIANALVDVSAMGLVQGTVPDRDRSGALGAMSALVSLGHIAGVLGASVLLVVVGQQAAIAIVGLMLPLLAIALWPRWRRLDEGILVPEAQVDLLRGCPVFTPLTLTQLEHLAARMTPVRYPVGAFIVREGDPGDGFYLVTDGEVRVVQGDRELRRLGPGSSFGEIALLRGVPRTATVEAVTSVSGWRLDAPAFLSVIVGNTWSRAAAEDVAQRWEPATAGGTPGIRTAAPGPDAAAR